MKKLLLIISLVIPLLYSGVSVDAVATEDVVSSKNCDDFKSSIVKIVNNYNVFSGNGFVYKQDDKYMYIVTSSKIVTKVNNFSVFYSNNEYDKAVLLGYDTYNEVAVFRANKVEGIDPVCVANSNYLFIGQTNYLYGYSSKENDFYIKTYLSDIGMLYSNTGNINIYKNIIKLNGNDAFNGVAVFDIYNRLVGMVSGYNSEFNGFSYVVESNKLIKIADSIMKTGNYNINYIKYKLVDYGSLSTGLRKGYGVNNKASNGVVVITFKPLNYIFGGLNQGMVIKAVNGVNVKNGYELDKQLMRYDKKSKVCLKVIKKNGKEKFYYVKV